MSDSTDVHLHEKAQFIRMSRVIEPPPKKIKNTKKKENERQIAICRKEYMF